MILYVCVCVCLCVVSDWPVVGRLVMSIFFSVPFRNISQIHHSEIHDFHVYRRLVNGNVFHTNPAGIFSSPVLSLSLFVCMYVCIAMLCWECYFCRNGRYNDKWDLFNGFGKMSFVTLFKFSREFEECWNVWDMYWTCLWLREMFTMFYSCALYKN